ncbi:MULTISPECIES: uroporphyrinogen-III C-methyltransferase [unclassified Thioalkalivibrio]|uniref:uroporphyrinogen-III C-methyltransferase n=1 Tax=unclassified Thioalkalivibrio TaxID=2621013 RepID=UPI00047806A6|nr:MULTISPECIES: uroporphyrinogen-III C-methyltransferase [unclassified Thioalkalivibrio]
MSDRQRDKVTRIGCGARAGARLPLRGERKPGCVDLVGAGPGDPGLLTLDAVAAMQHADVLLHDRLIPEAILELANPQAQRLYVGKARSRHSCDQGDLNERMIALAREGHYVVRLKGGDPFVYGRGGEEAAAIAAAGIPVRIVPGITAAGGCAAYAGIPLTHRDHAYRCQFVTAHRRAGETDLDWASLVQPQQTLVVYMGLHTLAEVCGEMMAAGADGAMPAALVEQGTRPMQRVIEGTLADLPTQVADLAIQSPALLIVGEVVRLRETIAAQGAQSVPGTHEIG